MNITIDIDALRRDLIDYFGSAISYYPVALMDVNKIQMASDSEIVEIAIQNNFNLYNYEIKDNYSKKYKK